MFCREAWFCTRPKCWRKHNLENPVKYCHFCAEECRTKSRVIPVDRVSSGDSDIMVSSVNRAKWKVNSEIILVQCPKNLVESPKPAMRESFQKNRDLEKN